MIRPGPLNAMDAAELNAALDTLKALAKIDVVSPVTLRRGPNGQPILGLRDLAADGFFFAELKGHAATTTTPGTGEVDGDKFKYTWVERVETDVPGVWEDGDRSGGGTGDDATGFAFLAEASGGAGSTALADGTLVLMRPEGDGYEFIAPGGDAGTPLTVKLADGSVVVVGVGTEQFDQTAGFTLADLTGGVAKVGLSFSKSITFTENVCPVFAWLKVVSGTLTSSATDNGGIRVVTGFTLRRRTATLPKGAAIGGASCEDGDPSKCCYTGVLLPGVNLPESLTLTLTDGFGNSTSYPMAAYPDSGFGYSPTGPAWTPGGWVPFAPNPGTFQPAGISVPGCGLLKMTFGCESYGGGGGSRRWYFRPVINATPPRPTPSECYFSQVRASPPGEPGPFEGTMTCSPFSFTGSITLIAGEGDSACGCIGTTYTVTITP